MRPDYHGGPVIGPWHEPWLIQRLNKGREFPEGHPFAGMDNPFSFGGGLPAGGFSKEAMNLFRPIFSFDYMGSSEFEWGACPNAMKSIVLTFDQFAQGSFEIDEKNIHFAEWDARDYKKPVKGTKKTVYVFAKKDHLASAETYIRSLTGKSEPSLKEWSGFRRALLEPLEAEKFTSFETRGWLDLDNCLMFFIDREMFEKTMAMLELLVKGTAEKKA